MHRLENITGQISQQVSDVSDQIWQFELAALAAQRNTSSDPLPATGANTIINLALQIAAFFSAIAILGLLIVRFGGTSTKKARKILANSSVVFAFHGEDTTRTRHLRRALANYQLSTPDAPLPILLLGRPAARVGEQFAALNVDKSLGNLPVFRPLSFGCFVRSLPRILAHLLASIGQTGRFHGAIPLRDRFGMAYRFAQGAAQACWWRSAGSGSEVRTAIFAHTGNADSSQLELAMQRRHIRTVHVVHGTNIGWPFAGLSNIAIFPSGADARLAATLPSYEKSIALPLAKPGASLGDGKWAVLTSYTHLQNPAYKKNGAGADIDLVRWISEVANAMGQDPKNVFWRPHPQIRLVHPVEREQLEQAIAEAGFTRWPDSLPYTELGRFSAVVTTPSTVMTDALRLGQPAIVASLAPMQSDLPYAAYPLLVKDKSELQNALSRVLEMQTRDNAFNEAWRAIEPGGTDNIAEILRWTGP